MMASFPCPPTRRSLEVSRLKLVILGVLLLCAFVCGSEADEQHLESTKPDDSFSLGVDVELVNLNVVVRDGHGRYLPNLQKEDFKVYEDGVQQRLTHFSAEYSPASVALLLDTGTCLLPGSYEERLNMMKSHALRFVRLLRSLDEVMVISFGSDVRIETSLTRDKSAVETAIDQISTNEPYTQLYRTVTVGLELMKREKKSRKVMVVFSFGGVDIPSILTNRDERAEVLRLAKEADVTVHPVSLPPSLKYLGSDVFQFPEMKNWTLGPLFLESLAAVTGGTYYWANSWKKYEEHLTRAFSGVAEELRSQYGMAYVPSNRNRKGGFRKIKVKVAVPGANVRTRRGYFPRPTQTKPNPLLLER